LVHKKDRLLDRELPESLGNYAGKLLAKRGVDIRFGRMLIAATPEGAVLDDQTRILSKTIISSVPSMPNPLIAESSLPQVHGRVKTNPFMQVEGYDNIWALGDCAMIPLAKENSFSPPTAQFAIREAKQLAKNLVAQIRGKEKQPFHFKALGMLGALGHRSAVAELFGVFKFSGFLAWVFWRFIYWMKLPGIDRKIKVAVYWFLDLFIPAETVQLKLSPSQGITQLHFEPGEIIFNEGDTGDFLYIITQGEVEVYSSTKGPLAKLGPGQYFGEMALLREAKRNATVRCTKATNVLALTKKDFGTLVANFKELKQNFEDTDRIRSEK
jgi:NADH dehydrogenase